MNKKIYALFDKQIKAYLNPLTFHNDGEAVRWLTTITNNEEKSNVSLYPTQFRLDYLGELDDLSGQFSNNRKEIMEAIAVQTEKIQPINTEQLLKLLDERYSK